MFLGPEYRIYVVAVVSYWYSFPGLGMLASASALIIELSYIACRIGLVMYSFYYGNTTEPCIEPKTSERFDLSPTYIKMELVCIPVLFHYFCLTNIPINYNPWFFQIRIMSESFLPFKN